MTNDDVAREVCRMAERLAEQMASDKFSRLLKGATIRWPANNDVAYCQDHCFARGLPDIEFTVRDACGFGLGLIAPGHGGEPYGNGAIHAFVTDGNE